MTDNDRIAAAQTLADVLERENEALRRIDYTAAVTFLPAKEAALAALTEGGPVEPVTNHAPHIVALGQRLTSLTAENRTLLERAMTVQTRIVSIILGAVAEATQAGNYGANGQKTPPRRSSPMTLSARA